jgi:hypothetical protein
MVSEPEGKRRVGGDTLIIFAYTSLRLQKVDIIRGTWSNPAMNISKACVVLLFLGSFKVGVALGQQRSTVKEPDASQIQTLSGQLIYHDGIRKWFELKLDRAQSGQVSIQLVPAGGDWKPIEVLRGCRVRSKGQIFLSPTGPYSSGYYSLDTTQNVQHIESVGTCTLKPPIQVDSKGKPDKNAP